MAQIDPELDSSWKNSLMSEFNNPYFLSLKKFLVEEKRKHAVYPVGSKIFEAFNRTPLPNIKVVILGQDPYHGTGQAHGLSFSVPKGITPPPSLLNIFKELKSDIGFEHPGHGNLEKWADQGVFLLNATLTVRANQAGSHQKKGWEKFTDAVIQCISKERKNIVFLLWGRYAQNKEKLIDNSKHFILKSVHPSPLSAYNGFFGCKHFSTTNQYLREKNISEIDWQL